MPVDTKEIPLVLLSKMLKLFPHQGQQNLSYEFEHDRQKYLYKELRHDNEDYRVLGPDPVTVAKLSNNFYSLLKKYFQDEVVETHYLVAKDRSGRPTVVALQPKVEGKSLLKIVQEGDGKDAVAMNNVVLKFEQNLTNIFDDPEYKKLPPKARDYFSLSAREIKLDNIIQTPDRRYVLIDF